MKNSLIILMTIAVTIAAVVFFGGEEPVVPSGAGWVEREKKYKTQIAKQDSAILNYILVSARANKRARAYKNQLDSSIIQLKAISERQPSEQSRIEARAWIEEHNTSLQE